jgi:hypothetical protein
MAALPPIRERLDFAPPDQAPPDLPATVKELELAVGNARRWRRVGVASMAGCVIAVTTAAALWLMLRPEGRTFAALVQTPAPVPTVEQQLLLPPSTRGPVKADNRLREWTVSVAQADQQRVVVTDVPAGDENETTVAFRLESDAPAEMRIASQPVHAATGMRFTARARFNLDGLRKGYVEVAVVESLGDGAERLLANRQPKRRGGPRGWLRANSVTMRDGLAGDGLVRFVLRGEFEGVVLVRECQFFRRE